MSFPVQFLFSYRLSALSIRLHPQSPSPEDTLSLFPPTFLAMWQVQLAIGRTCIPAEWAALWGVLYIKLLEIFRKHSMICDECCQ